MIPVFTPEAPFEVAPDVFVVPFHVPFAMPGVGGRVYFQPMVIRGAEPILVDTGGHWFRDAYLKAVFSLVAPEDVRWIFLSHEDGDHAGGVSELLERCPRARLITSFAGIFKLFEHMVPPLGRAQLLNPGESLDVGDRQIIAVRTPLFDSPSSRGLFDTKSRVLFSVDAFGAPVPTFVEDAAAVEPAALERGFDLWVRWNYPWHDLVDPARLRALFAPLIEQAPSAIVSYHAPVYRCSIESLAERTIKACGMPALAPMTQQPFEEFARKMSARD